MKKVLVAAACASVLAGCVTDGAPPPVAMATYPGQAFTVPWQLTPASTASEGQGERTEVAEVQGYGTVRGTPKALSELATPMTPYPGGDRAVEPCRKAVAMQVRSVGATSVEAAAAGPQETFRGGAVRQQVFFRVMYDRGPTHEVRQSSLTCTVKGRRVLDAQPA